ncbi:unnamed protein product [Lampetra fluviatilis]
MPVPCVATPGVSSRSYRVEKRHAAADSAPNGTRYDPTAHAGGGEPCSAIAERSFHDGRDRIWHLGARLARATRRSSREPGERRETVSSVGRLRATCRLERVERVERAVVWWLYPTGDDQARGTTGERGRRAVRNGHVATGAV